MSSYLVSHFSGIFLKHKNLEVCNTTWLRIVKQIYLDKRRQNTFTHTNGYKHEASDNRIACSAQQNADEDTRLSRQETLPISQYIV
jgi:hypothetical protein